MKAKLLLALISFLLMIHLPMLIKTTEGIPYLVVQDAIRFEQATYTNPYHELLIKMSRREIPKEEVVTVFVRQDGQGNMHFSDTPETSFHETQTYDVHTKSAGRIAFSRYWVWGAMLSIWILFYTILALLVWALRHLFERRELTPSTSKPKSTNTNNVADREAFFHQPLSPYQVLGIQENASAEQIKAAYRKQMANYHPDRVAHLGSELQDVARKKATEINRAYEKLLSK